MSENVKWGLNKEEDTEKNISSIGNRIFFYSPIDDESSHKINTLLLIKTKELIIDNPIIYLHIQSPGGFLHAGMSIVDTIRSIQKMGMNVITVIDGYAASAASLVSVVGTERYINENAYALIHQLSSAAWGKYEELKDSIYNCDKLMDHIKRIYTKYTKFDKRELEEILKRDIYLDAGECVKNGIADKIL